MNLAQQHIVPRLVLAWCLPGGVQCLLLCCRLNKYLSHAQFVPLGGSVASQCALVVVWRRRLQQGPLSCCCRLLLSCRPLPACIQPAVGPFLLVLVAFALSRGVPLWSSGLEGGSLAHCLACRKPQLQSPVPLMDGDRKDCGLLPA